jgi:predicted DNA-binding protein YlxM (UPF0122 family)
MPNRIRSSRRVILLGVVISLAFVGFFTIPRPVSRAQEPAKATDKKGLREQIVALHVEIDLMEVEQGVDRQAIADLIREERGILGEFDSILEGKQKQRVLKLGDSMIVGNDGTSPFQWWVLEALYEFLHIEQDMLEKMIKDLKSKEKSKFKDDLIEKLGEKFLDDFVNKLVSLSKASKEEFSTEREHLVEWFYEQVRNKATESVRDRMVSLKKNFTRRSAEIAGKKLDLAELERLYHEAR